MKCKNYHNIRKAFLGGGVYVVCPYSSCSDFMCLVSAWHGKRKGKRIVYDPDGFSSACCNHFLSVFSKMLFDLQWGVQPTSMDRFFSLASNPGGLRPDRRARGFCAKGEGTGKHFFNDRRRLVPGENSVLKLTNIVSKSQQIRCRVPPGRRKEMPLRAKSAPESDDGIQIFFFMILLDLGSLLAPLLGSLGGQGQPNQKRTRTGPKLEKMKKTTTSQKSCLKKVPSRGALKR